MYNSVLCSIFTFIHHHNPFRLFSLLPNNLTPFSHSHPHLPLQILPPAPDKQEYTFYFYRTAYSGHFTKKGPCDMWLLSLCLMLSRLTMLQPVLVFHPFHCWQSSDCISCMARKSVVTESMQRPTGNNDHESRVAKNCYMAFPNILTFFFNKWTCFIFALREFQFHFLMKCNWDMLY